MSTDLYVLLLRLAVILVLYVFLWQVVTIVRRDLSRPAGAAPAPAAPRWRLIVVAEGQADPAPVKALELAAANSLGRGHTNSIRLADDSVSATHARLDQRGQQWWLEDLGSTNGTLVNGSRIEKPTPLVAGDVITLGRVQLRLEPPS